MPEVDIITMKHTYFFLLIFIFNFNLAICNEISFVNGINDIPIFKNMKNIEDSLVVFDTNKGRFVTSEIFGENNQKKIESYYEKILPNLGWKKIKTSKYQRDEEILDLEYKNMDEKVHLIFKISPK